MSGSSLLSTDQIQQLLPALPQLAANIRDYGNPEPRDLQMLLLALDLDQPWMLEELGRWARMLSQVRGETDAQMLAYVRGGLQLRGIPEANAILAVAYVSDPATTSQAEIPSAVVTGQNPERSPQPISASAEIVGFGVLQPGINARKTLIVEGGPGNARINSSRAEVSPNTFGPGRTELTVT